MIVEGYASLPHYADHIRPILQALPEEHRGYLFAPPGRWWGPPLGGPSDRLTLVASWVDAQALPDRPLVYVEHGAGQTYGDEPLRSYAGAPDLDRVRLFIAPSEHVADRWRAAYPHTPVAVVGCPKLDRWHPPAKRIAWRSTPPTVAVTFHWMGSDHLAPEIRSAWRHYDHALPDLAADPRWKLLGHGHPRLYGTLRRRWARLGVEHTADFAEVLDRADLLVGDNTSALYEFASTGRPVVVVNAPWYRRDVEHGLRFWSHVPGRQVDEAADLAPTIARSLVGDDRLGDQLRARAVAHVYAATDGHASQRAAAAVEELIHE